MQDKMSKSSSDVGAYSSQEYVDSFDPALYLREYYSMEEIGNADTAIATEAGRWLSQGNRQFKSGIDVGCGPVLEYPFVFAPHVEKYELADYLPANLKNIELWLKEQSGAHDWKPLFRGILRTQGLDPDAWLAKRSDNLRNSIHKLRPIDLFEEVPLGEPLQYDLVTLFFCTECVGCNLQDWKLLKSRLVDLVAPGGSFFFGVMRGCTKYQILGKWFPAYPVQPDELEQLLSDQRVEAELTVHACPEFSESGFGEIIIARGTRTKSDLI
jgi:hypothetical protein